MVKHLDWMAQINAVVPLALVLSGEAPQERREEIALCPRGSPLGDPGPLGDLFVDLGPL